MTFSSSPADGVIPLVLDTSVLINLHASLRGASILEALPSCVLLPEPVLSELEHETSKTNGEYKFSKTLLAKRDARSITLRAREYNTFRRVIAGHSSLGDGEAATIAIASTRGYLAVIDDRRGRTHARLLMPDEHIIWSLNLFLHPTVRATLGASEVAEAIYLALRNGRMRISDNCCEHVVSIIGVRRALECKSLPAYKHRKNGWQRLAAKDVEIERG